MKDRPSVTTVTEGLGFSHAGLLHKNKNKSKTTSKTTGKTAALEGLD